MESIPIFTEMLSTTGLGHFVRCTALYDAIQAEGFRARFVLRSDGTAAHLLTDYEVEALDWTASDRLESIIAHPRPAFAIVDSYLAESAVYETLGAWARKLICIDDALRINYPVGAVILNPGIGAESLAYDRERHAVIAGAQYVLLREPFRDAPDRHIVEDKVKRVLITTGGEDRHGIVPDLIRIVRKKFITAELDVIVGPAFRNREEIEIAADKRCRLRINASPVDLFEAMRSADLAVAAGGQTTYELARLGVPMILIRAAENQRGNIEGLVAAGAAVSAGSPEDSNFADEVEAKLEFFQAGKERKNASRAGMRTIDGKGARRAIAIAASNAVAAAEMNLRPVEFEDAHLLLEWANDPEVRSSALNGETIEEAGHMRWLRGKLASSDTHMYIMQRADGTRVGQLRFDRVRDGEYEIDFSIAGEYRGRGLGKSILGLGIERLSKDLGATATLHATVKKNNPASAKAFLANDFRETGVDGELLLYRREARSI